MALQHTKQTPTGIDATYFKVVRSNSDWIENSPYQIIIYGWKDLEARTNYPKDPIFTEVLSIEFVEDPTREDIYTSIKLLEGWQEATDLNETNLN